MRARDQRNGLHEYRYAERRKGLAAHPTRQEEPERACQCEHDALEFRVRPLAEAEPIDAARRCRNGREEQHPPPRADGAGERRQQREDEIVLVEERHHERQRAAGDAHADDRIAQARDCKRATAYREGGKAQPDDTDCRRARAKPRGHAGGRYLDDGVYLRCAVHREQMRVAL